MEWPEITYNANQYASFRLYSCTVFAALHEWVWFHWCRTLLFSSPFLKFSLFRYFSFFSKLPFASLLRGNFFHSFSPRPQYSTKQHKKQQQKLLVKFSCCADVVVIPRQRWFMWLQKYLLPIITNHGLDSYFYFKLETLDELLGFLKCLCPCSALTVHRMCSFSQVISKLHEKFISVCF